MKEKTTYQDAATSLVQSVKKSLLEKLEVDDINDQALSLLIGVFL